MIRYVESIGTMQIWDVDGTRILHKKVLSVTVEQLGEDFNNLKLFLTEEKYRHGSKAIREIYSRIGFFPLFRICMEAFRSDFLKMCRWYCTQYFTSWHDDPDSEILKVPSFARALALMLGGDTADYLRKLREYNMRNTGYDHVLYDLMQEEFELFCSSKIMAALKSGEGLRCTRPKIGITHLTAICVAVSPELTEKYISDAAKKLAGQRKLITKRSLYDEILGTEHNFPKCDPQFHSIICSAVAREEKLQSKRLVEENHLELDVQSDVWKIFQMRGGGAISKRLDFTQINSASLRTEVKHYMVHYLRHNHNRGPYVVGYIAHALNVLTDKNPNIKFAADISDINVKELLLFMETEYVSPSGIKLSIVTINIIFSCCAGFFDYLMGDMRNPDMKSPHPYKNPFRDISFTNMYSYGERTRVIPESVMEQLDAHADELPEQSALLYKIFSNTGMRAKEALCLTADCVESSMHDNLFQLRYTPYKVLSARRKAGAEDFHRTLIHSSLAEEIRLWAKKTEALRERTGQPYLFLSVHPDNEGRLLGLKTFAGAVNGLLGKYEIPWHFSSRQCRKTVAVTLIENGATAEELTYALGHLNSGTSMKYYAEVRKMKLAELNTEFFKKQFELHVPSEQLEQFNEEERRQLYVDFRLERRRVELGFCLRHLEFGGCDRRTNLYGCINCRHLCTGRQYLKHWQELLYEQERYLAELERSYESAGIENYGAFREYQQALLLRDGYRSVVDSISESGCS